jgi:hypothetical protein
MIRRKRPPEDRTETLQEDRGRSNGPPERIDDLRVIHGIQQHRDALARGDRRGRDGILRRYELFRSGETPTSHPIQQARRRFSVGGR